MKNKCFFKNALCLLKEKELNFVQYFKYVLATSLFIILAATVVFAFAGFNGSYDLSGGYMVRLSYGTEITDEQQADYTQELQQIFNNDSIKHYTIYNEGEAEHAAVTVKFTTTNLTTSQQESLFEGLVDDIEANLNPTDFLGFNVENVVEFYPSVTAETVWLAVGVIVTILAMVFVYMLIRFDLWVALSSLLGAVHDAVLVLALMVIVRLHVSSLMLAIVLFAILLSLVRSINKFAKIREDYVREVYENKTNIQVVSNSIKQNFLTDAIIFATLAVLAIMLLFVGAPLAFEMSASLAIIAIVGDYSNLLFTPSLWALWYNRKNDKRLQKRLELKNSNSKKEEEKLVV